MDDNTGNITIILYLREGLKQQKQKQAGAELHTWKKFLALLAARSEHSFSSDTFGIIFSQNESDM